MREANTYLKICDILANKGNIKNLKSLASEKHKHLIILLMYLDNASQEGVSGCDIVNDTLYINCNSSSVATRIRFSHNQLLKSLLSHKEFSGIKHLKTRLVKAQPRTELKRTPSRQRLAPISPRNAEMLAETARSIDDEQLAKALLKLSRHTGKSR